MDNNFINTLSYPSPLTTQSKRESLTETQPALTTTSRISYHSAYSKLHSTSSTSVKRVNQIAPKEKIKLKEKLMSKPPGKQSEKKKTGVKSLIPSFLTSRQPSNKNINYDSIKPMIGLQKYVNLCGIERGSSAKGCLCMYPCKWKKLWTKNHDAKNQKLYESLIRETPNEKDVCQIQKDIFRTYPECPTFNRNPQFTNKLKQILTVYSIYDPQVGYAQGMNMVAAVLVYHIKQTQKAFWAFVDLMDDQQLRMIYFGNFESLKKHCNIVKQIIKQKIKDLHHHMEELIVIPDSFFFGWILSLMSNCVPLEYMHLVVDKFRENGWNFIYKLIITYLLFIKEKLLLCDDSSQFLMNITNDSSKEIGVYWEQLIENCHKVQF